MENSTARSEILDSIRRNLAASLPLNAVHEAHHAARFSNFITPNAPGFPTAVLIGNFCRNLESVAGNCLIVADESEAAETLQAIFKQTGAKKIAVSDSILAKRTIEFIKTGVEFIENAAAGVLFECDLGITGAQFGIAETGTLVLESEKELHRFASLIPPVHVCILEAKQIRQTLGEVLGILEKDLSRTITFITGASRTSDIELTLAIGVHGPGELFVILIDEA